MQTLRLIATATALLLFLLASPVRAEGTILTVSGKVTDRTAVDFTLSDLEALGTARVVTTTPWHDGEVIFEGVPMSELMAAVGAHGTSAFVVALNNYSTEIPLSDFTEFAVILAYRKDGREMAIADKGPLFVVYPYDDVAKLKSELYYTRSPWQVRSIEIE